MSQPESRDGDRPLNGRPVSEQSHVPLGAKGP